MTDNTQPVTREELKNELKKFAIKSELKKVEKNLRSNILKVEERVENIEDGQKRMEAILNKMSVQLDGFVGTVDDLKTDNQVGSHQINELRLQGENHEKRIKQLESSIPTS